MKQCKDCRFYTGKSCAVSGFNKTPYSSCSYFASNTKSDSTKCKDCRFYTGKSCTVSGFNKTPYSSCNRFSPYR